MSSPWAQRRAPAIDEHRPLWMVQTGGEDAALAAAKIPYRDLQVYRPGRTDKFRTFTLDPFAGRIFLTGLPDLFGYYLGTQ